MGYCKDYIAEHKGTRIGRSNFKLKILLLLEHYFKKMGECGERVAWWSAGDIAYSAFVNYGSAYTLLNRWATNSRVWGYVNRMFCLPEITTDGRERVLYSINKNGLTWIRRARERGLPGLVTAQEDINSFLEKSGEWSPEYFRLVVWHVTYYSKGDKKLFTGSITLKWPFKSKTDVDFSPIPLRERHYSLRCFIVTDINAAVKSIIRPLYGIEPRPECIQCALDLQKYLLKEAAANIR